MCPVASASDKPTLSYFLVIPIVCSLQPVSYHKVDRKWVFSGQRSLGCISKVHRCMRAHAHAWWGGGRASTTHGVYLLVGLLPARMSVVMSIRSLIFRKTRCKTQLGCRNCLGEGMNTRTGECYSKTLSP